MKFLIDENNIWFPIDEQRILLEIYKSQGNAISLARLSSRLLILPDDLKKLINSLLLKEAIVIFQSEIWSKQRAMLTHDCRQVIKLLLGE